MTLIITLASNPIEVSLDNQQINVNLTSAPVNVSLSNVGPQGPRGAAGATYYTWSEITASQAAAVNNAYVANNASQVVLTLPSTALFGDKVQVCGKGAGGWKIAQNDGQTIHFDSANTTTGVSGSLASQNTFDCVELVCITLNSDWLVVSCIGNITVT